MTRRSEAEHWNEVFADVNPTVGTVGRKQPDKETQTFFVPLTGIDNAINQKTSQ